jgi:alginate O-acetyltransferase complex protein AlgJ
LKIILKYQLISLFIGVLFLPVLNDSLGLMSFDRVDENRSFHDSLSIDLQRLDKFPSDAEAYINDNFSFRTPLLNAMSRIKFYGFRVSPKPTQTSIGKDGYMFLAGKETDQYSGRLDFSSEQLNKFQQLWDRRNTYFESKAIKSYFLICPSKHVIHDDKLPSFVRKSSTQSRVEQIKTAMALKCSRLIIDPSEELRKVRKQQKIFFKMDNHWNYKAGKIASELVLQSISRDFPEFSADLIVEWKDTLLKRGIHYNTLAIKELVEADVVPVIKNSSAREVERFGFKCPEYFPYCWDYERRFKSQNKNGIRALIIRDSFGEQLLPFLSEVFEESMFIFDAWQYGLNEHIIELYQPNVVIYVTVESLLENQLLNDK